MNENYNKVFRVLGGRKFFAVILSTVIIVGILVWTYILQTIETMSNISQDSTIVSSLPEAWAFCKIAIEFYFLMLSAYSGFQIWQKKIQGNNNNIESNNATPTTEIKNTD